MDIEIIKAVSDLPIVAILIYLVVRQQAEIDKLLERVIQNERDFTDRIIAIIQCWDSLGNHSGGKSQD